MSETPDCPLCMESFEVDDLHFYPCTCGYQICRFCWHRIRTDGNALCPACRKTYTEDPAIYQPLSQDQIQKARKERKQVEAQRKQKVSDTRQHLADIRVIQKHLVFVVGLSNKMADTDVLKRQEYFGKYGKIVKIVINPNTNYAGPQGPSASAYITYTKVEDALKAITSINNVQPPLKIRASLGTTKYCTHYLRNMQCPKQDCMYLHDVGEEAASFTKEDMQAGKHQIFEKNLLDNYEASVKSAKSKPTTEQSETPSNEEDWDIEDSLLPSQASWGTSKDEKQEYPKVAEKKIPTKEAPSKLSATSKSHPTTIRMSSPPTIITTTTTNSSFKSPTTASISLKSEPINVPKSEHITETLKTDFSTGWATSQETVPKEQPVSMDTSTTNNFLWPGVHDLGLCDLRINASDDELGFDPFVESSSGLEDLIAIEKQRGAKPVLPPSSYSWDSFWPNMYSSGTAKKETTANSYSLFSSNHQMLTARPPPMQNQFQIPLMSSQQVVPQSVATPFRFIPPNPMDIHSQQAPQPSAPQPQFMPFQSVPQSGAPTENKNWQDGLRALLPNINISFASEKEYWNGLDSSVTMGIETSSTTNPPPPGFSGTNGKQWNTSTKNSSATSVNQIPHPPPGFNSSTTTTTSQPTPGLINMPPSLHPATKIKPTPAKNTLPVSKHTSNNKPSFPNAPGQSDDPSILWSRVLSEDKEISTSNMAFPLPGETLNNATPNAAIQQQQQQQQTYSHSMTSWNAVVSGNQPLKNKPDEKLVIKEVSSDSPKLQKPSPIFGNQQKHAVKKPTAHVKPLKCSGPLDGFTTVHGSRQQQVAMQQISASQSSSRVSEMDDFTADFPSTAISGDYLQGNATSKSATKKKKRKGKDMVEPISEVIVGRIETLERPPIPVVEDERPKKVAKSKKRAKPSPPQQRKSPVAEKMKPPTQAPPIRILKSDGNAGAFVHTSTQSIADNDGGCKATSSSQEQEIVSRLTESTEKLLKNVLFETEAIKLNTEQISKDLKSALEKCKESSLSLSDLEKINLLLTPGKIMSGELDDDMVDTSFLERQVESARREAKMLEARLNEVIRKNMASELETLKRNNTS